jgi:hypothetical protein
MIDGSEVQLIIQGNQHIGNGKVSENISDDDLEIGESIESCSGDVSYGAGY